MIIKTKQTRCFTIIPNAIFDDARLSIETKGALGYLLSRPNNWTVRHDQLQSKLGIGRKWLDRILKEMIAAGYMERDPDQGRDEYNRFTTLNYIVRNIPKPRSDWVSAVPTAHRRKPVRDTDSGNKREETKTDCNNYSPNPSSSPGAETPQAGQDQYSEAGRSALANGLSPVFEGSRPYEAWLAFRGLDGLPPFDQATISGEPCRVLWLPSLYPPRRDTIAADREYGT